MSKGTKRASPGADEQKSSLTVVELTDDTAKKLTQIQRDLARAELTLERRAQATLFPVYERRREITKTIPNFWPVALLNHSMVAYHAQHNADQTALSYLEDIWVEKDPLEHRCFTIEFYFKENQFFSDRVLRKVYKYVPPEGAMEQTPDADGITEAMLDFDWAKHVEIPATEIQWKEADKALTKVYPRETAEDEDEIAEPGSFFNLFEAGDQAEVGISIANEVFPEAIEYFLGNVNDGGSDTESEDEDEEDDEAEIDLEKPRPKKRKV